MVVVVVVVMVVVDVHFVLDGRRTGAAIGRARPLRCTASGLVVHLQGWTTNKSAAAAAAAADAFFDGRRNAGPARIDHRQRHSAAAGVIVVGRIGYVVLLEGIVLLVAGVHLVLDELVDVTEGKRLLTDAASQYVLVWLASIRIACEQKIEQVELVRAKRERDETMRD